MKVILYAMFHQTSGGYIYIFIPNGTNNLNLNVDNVKVEESYFHFHVVNRCRNVHAVRDNLDVQ